jgi:hypothetical protein
MVSIGVCLHTLRGERVARERAARMGATSRRKAGDKAAFMPRRLESGAKMPEVFSGIKRPEGEQ